MLLQWGKKHPVWAAILAVVCLFILFNAAWYVVDTRPWKVKDPSDPRFDVSKFDPNDYRSGEEIALALRALLKQNVSNKGDFDKLWCRQSPCGTEKSFSENVKQDSELSICAQKTKNLQEAAHLYFYSMPGKTPIFGAWDTWVSFTSEYKILNICIRRAVVFPDS